MTATNSFLGKAVDLDAPPTNHQAIVPSDTTDLPSVIRSIYVGVGGDIKATIVGGTTVVYQNVPQGTDLCDFFTRVWATGMVNTPASGLVARW